MYPFITLLSNKLSPLKEISRGLTNPRFTAEYDFVKLANIGIAFAIITAAVLSVLFIFLGGLKFIVSGGEEEKVKQALHTIRYAIVGLIVTILSFSIVAIVGKIFGFSLIDYISLESILDLVNTFTSNIQPSL